MYIAHGKNEENVAFPCYKIPPVSRPRLYSIGNEPAFTILSVKSQSTRAKNRQQVNPRKPVYRREKNIDYRPLARTPRARAPRDPRANTEYRFAPRADFAAHNSIRTPVDSRRYRVSAAEIALAEDRTPRAREDT